MNTENLDQLLDAYFDGRLDDQSKQLLEMELLASREARVHFWSRAKLEDALRRNAGEAVGRNHLSFPAHLSSRFVLLKKWGLMAAAAVVLLGLGWWQGWRAAHPPAFPDPMAVISGPQQAGENLIAVVASSFQANWGSNTTLNANDSLTQGPVNLESGLASIRLLDGARIFVEGPARFNTISENAVELESGHFQVEVPAVARGFVLKVHGASITSQGGTFHVIASKDAAEIRCADSGVTVSGLKGGDTQVGTGQLAAIGSTGKLTVQRILAGTTSVDLKSRIRKATTDACAEWRAASAKRAKDPDLLVYFNMDAQRERTESVLLNQSANPAAEREAPIISAQWVDGRWPGKHALSFRDDTDGARVGIQGSYPKVTFAAWVGIDELKHHYNGIFYTDWGRTGETHWQITEKSMLWFSVSGGSQYLRGNSPEFALRSRLHEWKHLVTTYDSGKREVVHYVNGQEISRAALVKEAPVKFGSATLGNRPMSVRDDWGSRPLGGAIDEFMIFSRVLDADEVQALYQEGKPD